MVKHFSVLAFLPIGIWILCAGLFNNRPPAEFEIIKTRGQISRSGKSNLLSTGQKIRSNERLSFGSPKDYAVVIDDSNALFMLRPLPDLKKYYTKALPMVVGRRAVIQQFWQFRQFLAENDSIALLFGRHDFILDSQELQMNQDSFFYLEYLWKGDTIPKKLSFEGNRLHFDQSEIFRVYGEPIPPEEVVDSFTLYYYKAPLETSLRINRNALWLIPVDLELLDVETRIIMENCAQMPRDSAIERVRAYINNVYGLPDDDQFAKWISRY